MIFVSSISPHTKTNNPSTLAPNCEIMLTKNPHHGEATPLIAVIRCDALLDDRNFDGASTFQAFIFADRSANRYGEGAA